MSQIRDPQAPPSEEVFAARARGFLDSQLPRREQHKIEWGHGTDVVPVFDSPTEAEEREQVEAAVRWLKLRFDAGFGWIHGPVELGGGGLDWVYVAIYQAIEQEYQTPKLDALIPSLRIVTPGLAACASDDLKARLLAKLYRGDLVACQLFSEPNAGSDLANIRSSAVRDGVHWILNGQKVWTTGAHLSQIGLMIARTSNEGPAHRGLTAFVVDMQDPAVTVRPLRHMGGEAHFNEVFIDNLRIGDEWRVGEVGGGWEVVIATLMGERQALGQSDETPPIEVAERLEVLARASVGLSAERRAVLRDAVVRVRILAEVLDLTGERLGGEARQRGSPGAEGSIAKLLKGSMLRLATDIAGEILGPAMVAETGVWGTTAWARAAVLSAGLRIGGGTDEIQRNTLAERVLGLPREARPGSGTS